MNQLQIFNNPEFGSVRTIEDEGQIWFCGRDVAIVLEYTDTAQAIRKNCREDGVSVRQVIDSMGREQQAKFINEPNLYRLITHSKLPTAEKFERWIFEEVLPTIRRTGSYTVKPSNVVKRDLTTDDYKDAVRWISQCWKDNEVLAIVLGLLEQAGFSIPQIQKTMPEQRQDADTVDLVELLNQYSLDELCRMLDICKTSLYYYRIGKHKPHEERYKMIVSVLKGCERNEKSNCRLY